jgi:tetratricopeptide (TPR) repeat protein
MKANLEFLEGQARAGSTIALWSLGMPLTVGARTWTAFALAELGRFAEATSTGEQAVAEAEELADPYSLYHAYWALGATHLEQGEHERGANLVQRIERIAREADLGAMIENACGLLGHAHALAGRLDEAVQLLEKAAGRRNVFTDHRDILYLGDAYLRCGRLDKAHETVTRALDLALKLERRAREAWALRLLADIRAARDDRDEAETLYRSALALSAELGLRPATAHAHRSLGQLHRRSGKPQTADEHLATARTMYGDMGMTLWLAELEKDPVTVRLA